MTRRKLTPMLFVFRNFNSHWVVCRLFWPSRLVGAPLTHTIPRNSRQARASPPAQTSERSAALLRAQPTAMLPKDFCARSFPKVWWRKSLAGRKRTRYSAGGIYSLVSEEGIKMPNTEHENLLRSARSLLDRFMFEGDELRDDVANLCTKIDDVPPPATALSVSNVSLEEMINVAA
jgi:hypothetical protein